VVTDSKGATATVGVTITQAPAPLTIVYPPPGNAEPATLGPVNLAALIAGL
jgi:hypothetical protein